MAREAILGVFTDPGGAARALRALRHRGGGHISVVMPAPYPEVVEALEQRASPLGWATLVGALAGTSGGFALCIATSLAWPLLTSGKPIVSIPPFVIIAFELAVLGGALATLAALALGAYGFRRKHGPPRDIAFSADRIGLFASGFDPGEATTILRDAGAEEVRRVA